MGKGKKKSKNDSKKEPSPAPQHQGSGDASQQGQGPGPSQPQKEASGGPSTQQGPGKEPPQQQAWRKPAQERDQATEVMAWGRGRGSLQQMSKGLPKQPGSRGPSEQQRAWGRPSQQQASGGQPQQQAWGRPSQPQASGGPPQQQASVGQPQQQAWGRPSQQQVSGGLPQQQAWGRPSQPQVSGGPPQQQAFKGQPQEQYGNSKQQAPKTTLQQTVPPQTSSQQPTTTAVGVLKNDQQLMDEVPKKPLPGDYSKRPGIHTVVETNMMRLVFPPNFEKDVVHYDVIIKPDKPKYLLRRVFEKFREAVCPRRYPAFDGRKNAYSAKNLPFGDQSPEVTVKVMDVESNKEDKMKEFVVSLKKVAVLDLSWLRDYALGISQYEKTRKDVQALEIILRHGSALRYTPVGRSLFSPPQPGRVTSLTNGLDLWIGTFSAVVIGSRPYLNMDVAHKGFPTEQPVIHLMEELGAKLREGSIHQTVITKLTSYLKGLKVQYEIPGQPASKRTYRVNGLVDCARTNKFEYENKMQITVEEYFAQQKRYRVQHPFMPCLWVGSRTSKIYVPAELCMVVGGQVTHKKMDESQTKIMVRQAATNPETRKRKILDGFAKMNLNNQPTLTNEFHLSVQGEFEKVPARVLTAPRLQYQRPVSVFKGVWHAGEFFEKCELQDGSWTILNLDRFVKDNDLYQFHERLTRGAINMKMIIGKPFTPFQTLPIQRDTRAIIDYFQRAKDKNIRMVIVILPGLNNAYSCVKQISELRIREGIITQCVKSYTLKNRLSDATISNILLKINSKLNGVNHVLDPEQLPSALKKSVCIIIGADVTHPSPDSENIPSIAAVAASIDTNGFKYRTALRFQPPREEMIQDLEKIMVEHLVAFKQETNKIPTKIIFYRDGVSEGDLPRVMRYEVSAIRKAVASLHKNRDPHAIPLTFLVVQKRHHVRLFPTDMRMTDDRNRNVQAGTVVDTEITHPTHIDFYLVSHASIQGTARPTKYRCLCNESKLTEDEMEQLTYYLCHMFARCTRSVSYPAPTYYAHLAAFRARAYIHEVPIDLNNLYREQQVKLNVQITKNSPMFFV